MDKQKDGVGLGSARRRVSEYCSANFYATTSGHFHTRTMFAGIMPGMPGVWGAPGVVAGGHGTQIGLAWHAQGACS